MDDRDEAVGPLALLRLDRLLRVGLDALAVRYGEGAGPDPLREVYAKADEVRLLLAAPAGEPFAGWLPTSSPPAGTRDPLGWDAIAEAEPAWARLRERAGLSDVELDVVLLALGPEVDLRYERVYGYLLDDLTRRTATVGLALDLLGGTPGERLALRALFAAGAALADTQVVQLVEDDRGSASLLSSRLVVEPQVLAALLGEPSLDERLRGCARLVTPAPGPDAPTTTADLVGTLRRWAAQPREVRLRVRVPDPRDLTGDQELADALGRPVLVLDVTAAGPAGAVPSGVVAREVARHGAVAVVVADLASDALAESWVRALDASGADIVLAGPGPAYSGAGGPWTELTAAATTRDQRAETWARQLREAGLPADPADVRHLAVRFRLSESEVADAVAAARARTVLYGDATTAAERVLEAAKDLAGRPLSGLARRTRPAFGWDDIVLAGDARRQLRDLCERSEQADTVLGAWGFRTIVPHGAATTALFTGPPGTGKTMAAEVVAGQLSLDLFTVDLAAVVSKYIGETEKNLEKIFEAAARADVVLLFDEADALFGRRSVVRDAHDRYANLEIAYLLQRMERHDGVVVLATNLRDNIDEAFVRRLQFVVEFPMPDRAQRRGIWDVCLPASAPLSADVDLDMLATAYRLTGGHIRNVALAAAYAAAVAGEAISMAHLVAAAHREHQKLGKTAPPLPGSGD